MAVRIQLRNDTAANWTDADPVLAAGEFGLETDTNQFKIGDGISSWTVLEYGGIQGELGPTGPQGETGLTGEVGPMGPPGLDGADGADGLNGAPGAPGSDGSDGADGADGADGKSFNFVFYGAGSTGFTAGNINSKQFIEFYGYPDGFSAGQYVKVQLDSTNWVEGLINYVAQPFGYPSSLDVPGFIQLVVLKWSITTSYDPYNPITEQNDIELLDVFPNAKLFLTGLPGAGYSAEPNISNIPGFSNSREISSVITAGSFTYYCNPGAYRVGDLVKILPVSYTEYGTEYTPSSEMAETYFIGEVTEVKNSGGASSDDGLTVTLTDSFANQNVIDNLETWGSTGGWSIGLYAPPGATGPTGPNPTEIEFTAPGAIDPVEEIPYLIGGSYVKSGPLVHFRIDIDTLDKVGDSGMGTGQYAVYLPLPAKYDYSFPAGYLYNNSEDREYAITGRVTAGESLMRLEILDTQGISSFFVPFTNTGSIAVTSYATLHISGSYIEHIVESGGE